LDHATPCQGRTVRQLLGHLVGLTAAFRAAANKDFGPLTDTNPDAAGWPDADDGWHATLDRCGPLLVEAWRSPAAWEGMTRAGGVDLPGEVAGLVALDEVVLHGWDLARATGQDYKIDEETAAALLPFVSGFDPAGTPGMFGPAVDTSPDSATFEQVLARAGRDPEWTTG
ncbi:MAG: TIGR03086 family metal-binding protein, partial [Nocardioidaceae bacterium]